MIFNNSNREAKTIAGWGRTNFVNCEINHPNNISEIQNSISESPKNSTITRGLGRSYGDAAQNKDGLVFELNKFDKIKLNDKEGFIEVGAGVSLDQILKYIVPRGFFLPVSPGTRFVTVGGAIAADVHGKNHHIDGSFGNHVRYIKLVDGNGDCHKLYPEDNQFLQQKNLFWATVGGMGLTGVIVEASFNLIRINSSLMSVDTSRFNNIESLMETMAICDKEYRYSVAWIDSLHKDFRGVMTCGNHAEVTALSKKQQFDPFFYDPKAIASAPPFLPSGLLNKFTVRAFNEAWFRKASKEEKNEIQTISQFFHPLDGVNNWNRIYGKSGFLQYQFVVPEAYADLVPFTMKKLRNIGAPSFLNVLKRFGPANKAFMSFPIEGWTLAIDLPFYINGLFKLLDEIDNEVIKAGGRIYMAKDSRQNYSNLHRSYPHIKKWKEIRNHFDSKKIFSSCLASRCGLNLDNF